MYADAINNEKKPTKKNRRFFHFLVALICIALIGGGVFFYFNSQNNAGSDAEINAKVGKHIIIPDEEPTITTVDQTNDLTSQPFFANVKTGDKILIYPQTARIVIFRPSENILVNVGPIIDDSTSTDTSTDTNTNGAE